MDMAYWAVDPGAPKRESSTRGATKIFSNQFQGGMGVPIEPVHLERGFKYSWYDGYVNADFDRETWSLIKHSQEYNHPDEKVLGGMPFQQFGSVVIGKLELFSIASIAAGSFIPTMISIGSIGRMNHSSGLGPRSV